MVVDGDRETVTGRQAIATGSRVGKHDLADLDRIGAGGRRDHGWITSQVAAQTSVHAVELERRIQCGSRERELLIHVIHSDADSAIGFDAGFERREHTGPGTGNRAGTGELDGAYRFTRGQDTRHAQGRDQAVQYGAWRGIGGSQVRHLHGTYRQLVLVALAHRYGGHAGQVQRTWQCDTGGCCAQAGEPANHGGIGDRLAGVVGNAQADGGIGQRRAEIEVVVVAGLHRVGLAVQQHRVGGCSSDRAAEGQHADLRVGGVGQRCRHASGVGHCRQRRDGRAVHRESGIDHVGVERQATGIGFNRSHLDHIEGALDRDDVASLGAGGGDAGRAGT